MSDSDADRDQRRLELGRELIVRWLGLIKALRLYDWRHDGVRSCAQRVRDMVAELIGGAGILDVALRNDSLYIDGKRVKESDSAASAFATLAQLLSNAGIGSFSTDAECDLEHLQLFAHLVISTSEGQRTPEEMLDELRIRGVGDIEVTLADSRVEVLREGHELQKGVYTNSIRVLKSVFNELHSRDRINMRRVKRVVQQLMDSLDSDPGYALNLTHVKNYDEYTFNHSVNVGVMAIALGRVVGLTRRQLYVVGQAGLLHDLGKLCIPKEVLNKPGRLTPEERAIIQAHPSEGFVSIATKQGVTSETIGIALGAYEHHLNVDGTGYPEAAIARPIGLVSRILAIVDRYDAMTSARVYRSQPISPPKALTILYGSQRHLVDHKLLRFFMNMLGRYPLGTAVRLSDDSVGIVLDSGSVAQLPHLPCVKIILDQDGRPGSEELLDLSATAKEPGALHVLETLNLRDYGIEALDYLL